MRGECYLDQAAQTPGVHGPVLHSDGLHPLVLPGAAHQDAHILTGPGVPEAHCAVTAPGQDQVCAVDVDIDNGVLNKTQNVIYTINYCRCLPPVYLLLLSNFTFPTTF